MKNRIDNIQPEFSCIYDLLAARAERNLSAVAILAPERNPLTYGRLFDQITQSTERLRSLGIGRNDRVAVVLPNGPEMAVAFLAVASCATSAPLNPGYRENEFDFYLSDLGVGALIVQSGIDSPARAAAHKRGIPIIELSPALDAEAGIFSLAGEQRSSSARVDFAAPEDVALVLHTSGTTSRPKIVPLTHANICASADNIRGTLELSEDDRALNVMPLFHIHGLMAAVLASLAAGGGIVCTPGFYAPRFFKWMEAFRPTWYTAVPTMHQAVLARAAQNREIIEACPLRFLRSSSASLPAQIMKKLESAFNAPVIEAYGMTEAAHQMASNLLPPGERKAGSVGFAAGPEIAIMGAEGDLLPAGKTGELVLRGPNVMHGYENNHQANKGAFTNGWFRTGDQGYMDDDGCFFITGRLKEIINRGGEKISPREVDEVLLDHPDIEQAVTFAFPDPRLGEDVAAAVVLKENASVTEMAIREFASERLADFKVPRLVIILDEIPKGPTGKLQRIGLAEKLGLTKSEGKTTGAKPSFEAEDVMKRESRQKNKRSTPQHSSVYNLLAAPAKRNPDAIAILASERSPLTYGRLFDQITQTAERLRSLGIERNDRVAIVVPNGPEMAVAFLAVTSCATSAPLNPGYRENEFDFYLSDLGVSALIVQAGIDSPARAVAMRHNIPLIELSPTPDAEAGIFSLAGKERSPTINMDFAHPEDVALVLHTSGTTSRPKIVPLTHSNICASTHDNKTSLLLTESDRCLSMMQLFHVAGLMGTTLTSLTAGASIVYTPGFIAPKFFEWMRDFQPTWYNGVPTMHQAILARAAENRQIIEKCPLRFIRSSSAPLPPSVMKELEDIFRAPVIETYGMTEASCQITCNPFPSGKRKAGSVGLAAGPEVAIMDEEGNLMPAGIVGEIVIRGPNVISGYEDNPAANKSAFTDGWFRTGDQGHMDTDGYVFITGRLKETINRGGEKISPREVDEVLLDHPDIDQAVTFALPDPRLGEDVAAAVVLKESASVTEMEIREFAAGRLADFKVPRLVVILDEIPKGPTGKLQRIGLAEKLGLAEVERQPTGTGVPYAAPRNPTEEKLATMWADVLGLEQVGIHDEFLDLGGDSILATFLISRVRETFRVEISLLHFFEEASTIGRMSEWLAKADSGEETPASVPLRPVPRDGELPLSFAQERQWFIQQLDPDNCAYNCTVCLCLTGVLDISSLEKSISEIVRRHEALRTTLPMVNGRPIQRIEDANPISLRPIDISELPEAKRQAQSMERIFEEARKPFDLSKDPMLRPFLVRLNEEEHILLLTIHHIAFDGWSAGVLQRELTRLYEAFAEGKPSPLPDLVIQYADFGRWQRECLDRGALERQRTYWKRTLSGCSPVLDLPSDRPRPAKQAYRGRRSNFSLPEDLSHSLKELCQHEGSTLFMILLASFQCLLYRYSGQTEIVVGCPISGRTHVQAEDLIGMLINTLPLRADFSGAPTFRDLLTRVRRTALEAYQNQHLPLQKVVEIIRPDRDLSYMPLFQIVFALQNAPMPELELSNLKVIPIEVDKETSIADLSLELSDEPEGISGWFEYDTDLFDEARIKRMVGHFQTLLQSIIDNPGRRVSEFQIFNEAERNQLLVIWNDTATDYPREATIHGLFEAQTKKAPDELAVVFDDQRLTYRQLNERANMLARYLRSHVVGLETVVGVCMERSVDMIVGFLSVLKAGGAYLPLDPTYPTERLAVMLDDARAPMILTHEKYADLFSGAERQIVCLDTGWEVIEREGSENLSTEVSANNLAYVMYTSGSTGRPKGVAVPHRAVARLVMNTDYVKLGPSDRIAQISNCSFDAATFEIWGALLLGARLVGIPRDVSLSPKRFAAEIKESGITTIFLTTALFNLIARETPEAFSSVRHLLFGGEAVEPRWVKEVLEHSPPERLLHVYGPTENTTFSTWYLVEDVPEGARTIPVGRPIANTQAYVLDPNMQPVPVGIPGELYLGGDGLARGYLNSPELTDERFVPNPFDGESGTCLYRTGDLARYLSDGNMEFVGRIDNQIKIRGFRIEPEEVEIILSQFPTVREVVVLAREDRPGERYLTAYIVPEIGKSPTVGEIRDFLKQKAPDYMLPSAFVMMDAFPLTPNGKVDRRALPAPESSRLEPERQRLAPQDSVELQMVKLWENLLDVRPIGTMDNFFELGGHSLMAARLFSQIEKLTGKALSLGTLFEMPTIKQLAGMLREEGWTSQWESLVPIQPEGSKSPLFFVHPISGNILGYKDLAHHLGKDQPFYGLQAVGLDGKRPPLDRVEDMASHYLEEMRSVLPEGPYLIGGRCSIGGLVAYEMAQQLVARGGEVALVVLIDVRTARRLRIQQKDPDRHKSLIRYPRRNVMRLLGKISRLFDDAQERRFKEVTAANRRAWDRYVPKPFPGRISYFLSEKHWTTKPARFLSDEEGGWKSLARDGLEYHVIPGNHDTMMQLPGVEILAGKLKVCLDEAQKGERKSL